MNIIYHWELNLVVFPFLVKINIDFKPFETPMVDESESYKYVVCDLKGFIKVFNIHFQTIALFLSERQVALLTRFFSGCSGNTAGESFANGNIPHFILHDFSLFLSSYCFIQSFSLTLLAMQLKGTMMNCSNKFDRTYILRHFLCYNICWLWLSASQCNARKSHNCSFTLPLSPAICNKQTSDAFTM